MKLRRAPTGTEPPAGREVTYDLALSLSEQLARVIEQAEGTDRLYLETTLDQRLATIPMLVEKALATPEQVRRRGLFENARLYATECEAILGVIARRGTVDLAALEPVVMTCRKLRDHLAALTVPPR